MVDAEKLKETVYAVIAEHGLENLTQKQVLRYSEAKLGLEEKALKSEKEQVSAIIDQYIESQPSQEAEEEEEEVKPAAKRPASKAKSDDVSDVSDAGGDDEEDEDEKPAKKKAKSEPVVKAEKNFLVVTASGEECPKKIKDLQKRSMTRSGFLNKAPEMNLELWGNKLMGKARSFTSDNMGWYTGGKVEIDMGDGKIIWGQIGVNLTIMGSKEWKK